MAKQNRKYTIEFKQEAVKLALKSPSIQATSKELGVPLSTLHTWIHQLKEQPTTNTKPVNSEMAVILPRFDRHAHANILV